MNSKKLLSFLLIISAISHANSFASWSSMLSKSNVFTSKNLQISAVGLALITPYFAWKAWRENPKLNREKRKLNERSAEVKKMKEYVNNNENISDDLPDKCEFHVDRSENIELCRAVYQYNVQPKRVLPADDSYQRATVLERQNAINWNNNIKSPLVSELEKTQEDINTHYNRILRRQVTSILLPVATGLASLGCYIWSRK